MLWIKVSTGKHSSDRTFHLKLKVYHYEQNNLIAEFTHHYPPTLTLFFFASTIYLFDPIQSAPLPIITENIFSATAIVPKLCDFSYNSKIHIFPKFQLVTMVTSKVMAFFPELLEKLWSNPYKSCDVIKSDKIVVTT